MPRHDTPVPLIGSDRPDAAACRRASCWCANGFGSAVPGQVRRDFWHRDTLTGDWGGLRAALAAQGIAFSATYTGEVFEPQIDVDLDTLDG